MPEKIEKDLKGLAETIEKLEEEVRILKSKSISKKDRKIFSSIVACTRRVFSRENLEIFLSLTSLVISATIALYLAFFQ